MPLNAQSCSVGERFQGMLSAENSFYSVDFQFLWSDGEVIRGVHQTTCGALPNKIGQTIFESD